jgi:hypothetical protein
MGGTTPSSAPVGAGAATPVDVFLSHVEEDAGVALQLSDALRAAGFSTWCYELDSIPGPSYLLQTAQAIERSRAVVVLISAHSLGSNQVTAEVVRAHEAVKPFVPVLIGISHVEFGARQPEWREAIGSATAVSLPVEGVAAIVPRIVNGLRAMGIEPGEPRALAERADGSVATAPYVPVTSWSPTPAKRRPSRRAALIAGVALALVLVAALLVTTLAGGGDTRTDGTPGQPSATSSGGPSETGAPTPTASGTSEVVRDSRTTPVQMSQAPARVSVAKLVQQECPPPSFPGECTTAPEGSRFLVLDFHAWGAGDLLFSEAMSMEAFRSYVSFEGRRASPVRTWLLEGSPRGFRVVYASLPPGAAGQDANLFWPDNEPLRIHPRS